MCRAYQLEAGSAAAFYGIVHIEKLWAEVLHRSHSYYYIDNSYFDCVRGGQFRVTQDALQDSGTGDPDWNRYAKLGIKPKPWRKGGKHILVVAQSDYFMQNIAMWPHGNVGWQHYVLGQLRAVTDRQIIFRHWSRDKRALASTLAKDMEGAWAVVVHTSAAANEALLAGLPVFTTGPCAASAMAGANLSSIEQPCFPEDRERWAAALAAKQWTLDELRAGRHL